MLSIDPVYHTFPGEKRVKCKLYLEKIKVSPAPAEKRPGFFLCFVKIFVEKANLRIEIFLRRWYS
jgi:hypothetical protein